MSLSRSSRRRHGLAAVRRAVRRGRYSEEDLERWAEELGPVVYEIAGEDPPERDSEEETIDGDDDTLTEE